jgi:N-acetyl-anhydromuramyl-L-alanine amidase AmpD
MAALILHGKRIEVPFATNPSQMGRLPTRARRSQVVQAILHHDACLSALACSNVLHERGLSTHFCIDNDGTVFQFADPGTSEAFHALGHVLTGGLDSELVPTSFNRRSIGIDLSNAVDPQFAHRYHPPRDQATLPVHGRPYTGLLPYPWQVEVALVLLRVLRAQFPAITNDHREALSWRGDLTPDTPGIWAHGQVSRVKVDPFGFPFSRLSEV